MRKPDPELVSVAKAWAWQQVKPKIESMELVRAAEHIVQLKGFTTWPASGSGKHHTGSGGLSRHTEEVMRVCDYLIGQPEVKTKVCPMTVMMGALWHDVGKLDDYHVAHVFEADYSYSPNHDLEGHVAASYRRWLEYLATLPKSNGLRTIAPGIGHCILAHHGRKEWGSPVEPATASAKIVHLADVMSAWVMGGHFDENGRRIGGE